ncbi:MAG: fatty acid desaturase [Acidimicrobiia bacterium]|nr:fatty acid desaturase [Acidimicrobiia bacterium]
MPPKPLPLSEAIGSVPMARRRVGDMSVTWLVILAPLACLVGALLTWPTLRPHFADVALFLVIFVISGLGVTVGYHRTFAHRAMRPRRALKIVLAIAGSISLEGGPLTWSAMHRVHHKRSDRPGDPHSPVGHGGGMLGSLRGFLHAHVGWIVNPRVPDRSDHVDDLAADRDLRIVNGFFPLIAVATFLVPLALGAVLHRTWAGALGTLMWAGVLRVTLTQHVTFSINSICHMVGRRSFKTTDRSRNVWWLALPSFGESWHNNHHAFPRLARHGLDRGQVDLSALVIRLFEKLRWADQIEWPDPAILERKRLRAA